MTYVLAGACLLAAGTITYLVHTIERLERELGETRGALAEWYEEAWHARRRAERAELGHDERTPLHLFPGARN